MKKNKIIFVVVFFALFFTCVFYNNTTNSFAYWGMEGDCRDYHGVTYINIAYDKDASLSCDGTPSESFWTDPSNQIGFVTVPLAGEKPPVGPPSLIIYLNLTFVMNDEYLFILAEWEDHSTMPVGMTDGFYFCWNINCPDFKANYTGTMTTKPFGEPYGLVDGWGFETKAENPGIEFKGIDNCYDEAGRFTHPSDVDDVSFAYTYQTDDSYTVEIKRKLDTTHPYDVQITQKKLYLFNMAILDNGNGIDHAVSWTYGVDFREESPSSDGDDDKDKEKKEQMISGFMLTIFLLATISSIISISLFTNYRISKKK